MVGCVGEKNMAMINVIIKRNGYQVADRYFYTYVYILNNIRHQGRFPPWTWWGIGSMWATSSFHFARLRRCADQTRDSYQIKTGKANYTDNNLSLPPSLPVPQLYAFSAVKSSNREKCGSIHGGRKKFIPIEDFFFAWEQMPDFHNAGKKWIKKMVSFWVDIFSAHY